MERRGDLGPWGEGRCRVVRESGGAGRHETSVPFGKVENLGSGSAMDLKQESGRQEREAGMTGRDGDALVQRAVVV